MTQVPRSISALIKDNIVKFNRFQHNMFYYDIFYDELWWQFPVPLDDIGNGELKQEDKAIFFMRWIRKAIEDQTLVKRNV